MSSLKALSGKIDGVPFIISIPTHGESFYDQVRVLERYRDQLRRPCWRDDSGTHNLDAIPSGSTGGYCWIAFNHILEPGSIEGRSYGIRSATANSVAMDSWVYSERRRVNPPKEDPDDDHESVWRYLPMPADRLTMRLQLPAVPNEVRPELRCRRHRSYPDFPLIFKPEIASKVSPDFYDEFVVDTDLQKEEQYNLRYEPHEGAWLLEIERPMPGYMYELRWKVPEVELAEPRVLLLTKDYQAILLELGARLLNNTGEVSETDKECVSRFNEFADALMNQYAGIKDREYQDVFLLVYNQRDLNLHPTLSRVPSGAQVPLSYRVPLGGGLAGAAFVQRRVLAWSKTADLDSLIRPVPIPGLDARYLLAVPIFYPRPEDG